MESQVELREKIEDGSRIEEMLVTIGWQKIDAGLKKELDKVLRSLRNCKIEELGKLQAKADAIESVYKAIEHFKIEKQNALSHLAEQGK